VTAHKTPPRFSLVMTRSDDHLQNAVPTQKLEWVTPKISLMDAGDTESKFNVIPNELAGTRYGPS
jgi:hypothetical protein